MTHDLQIQLIFCTVPTQEVGREIAKALVEERLAACVSLIPGVESHYLWNEKYERASEIQLVIKAKKAKFTLIEEKILKIHPYECPEIIAFEIDDGYHSYLNWIERAGEP